MGDQLVGQLQYGRKTCRPARTELELAGRQTCLPTHAKLGLKDWANNKLSVYKSLNSTLHSCLQLFFLKTLVFLFYKNAARTPEAGS
jgi:hypothetical protein